MDLPAVTASDVDFRPAMVVIAVKLRSREFHCPAAGFTMKARYDTRERSATTTAMSMNIPRAGTDLPGHLGNVDGADVLHQLPMLCDVDLLGFTRSAGTSSSRSSWTRGDARAPARQPEF